MVDKHVYVETYGCQMNVGDSERLIGFLAGAGYAETKNPSDADLILINTCSVRDKAEHKVYSAAGRYGKLKAEKPGLKIAIAGCVAQQKGEALLKRLPYLDLVVGTQGIHRIAGLIAETTGSNKRIAYTDESLEITGDEFAVSPAADGTKAFVSIMRGCDNFCSYCIVPHTRGREASRPHREIITDVERLASNGVKEVTLLGQNVNSYGLKGRESKERVSFPGLLSMVCRVEGIERVRFITSHPKDISSELIELFKDEQKLCRHVHLPIQSGSNRILKAMKRGYDVEGYSEKFLRLKSLYADMAVTTDVIVGFPGETDEDFELTMKAVHELKFDNIFAFKYSARPGTKAAAFDGQTPEEVKDLRLDALLAAQREITFELNKKLVGSTVKVLVEDKGDDKGEHSARTACNRIVHFAAPELARGQTAHVKITAAHPNSLKGVLAQGGASC